MIKGNRELLGQTVANLIDNATKYTVVEDGVEPVITVTLTRENGKAKLCVSDNGPGIPEEHYQHVLERFTRLESSRTQQGNGLGLSLVNAVVNLHEGQLELSDNEPGLDICITLSCEK